MAKVLTSTHAEDVGGRIVEPGQEIPDDADPEVVKRLEAEGKLHEPKAAPKKTQTKEG
jgi:hypothetical protein